MRRLNIAVLLLVAVFVGSCVGLAQAKLPLMGYWTIISSGDGGTTDPGGTIQIGVPPTKTTDVAALQESFPPTRVVSNRGAAMRGKISSHR